MKKKLFAKMVKKVVFLGVLFVSILSMVGCSSLDTAQRREKSARTGENVTLYAACDSGADTVTAKFMRDFAKRVEEKSGGKINVETYSDSQVGGDSEIFEACQGGNISFVFQATSPQVSFIPEAAVLDAPMAFDNIEIARKVLDGELFEKLKKYYSEKGVELLGIADQGFRETTSNKRIEKLSDFKGLKIRTMENPYHIKFWKALGANPTPMSYSEVYIGLQQGTIDAQENPLEAIIVPRFYEQQDYLVNTNHFIHPVTCIASSKVMDSLTEKERKIVYEAAEESKIWARNTTDNQLDDRIKVIVDSGTEIINLDKKTLEEMKRASESVWTDIENNLGSDLIDTLRAEIEKYN
ncbi:TRAP transporter substrate-binding protein [Peptacetobacter hiranonis]|uniref:TRAP transporter substrate-binding protein n=1 Tax=Peptacetobacter hiranonis TaxID=89152 RepID=UPI0022E3824A|nr:TRAP transporter substrate-binding protein [Peptacetobacter hiranonis]